MFSRPLAFVLLALGCVTAAAGGAYVATRHNGNDRAADVVRRTRGFVAARGSFPSLLTFMGNRGYPFYRNRPRGKVFAGDELKPVSICVSRWPDNSRCQPSGPSLTSNRAR